MKRLFSTVLMLTLLGTLLISHTHAQTSSAPASAPLTIREALKTPAFQSAYKRAFAPYLGMKWVSAPTLEEPAKGEVRADGAIVRVFMACRPHACGSERLSFVFEPASGKGWGRISIKSDVQGDAPVDAVETLLNRAIGTEK